MKKHIAATATTHPERYDWLTDQFLEWVREVPLESDAVANIPRIIERYEKRKTFWEKLKLLFI